MTFWTWFQRDGDQLFTFVSLAAVALQGVDGLPHQWSTFAIVAGILANAAHRSFFPNAPVEPAKVNP